jgi:quercetin dioxygenase-like cupin family protein
MDQGADVPEPRRADREAGEMIEFDLRALTTFRDGGPCVTVLSDIGAARVVLFAFKAGQELKEHRTSSQILMQVLRGQIRFTAAGRTVAARAGTLLQVEAEVPHRLAARTNAVVLVTMVPSPATHSLDAAVFHDLKPLVARAADR